MDFLEDSFWYSQTRTRGFDPAMWRAFFCAIGIMFIILGVECLMIETATFAAGVVDEPIPGPQGALFGPPPTIATTRTVKPSDWQPWSFLASGTIVLLYSLTIPRRSGAES